MHTLALGSLVYHGLSMSLGGGGERQREGSAVQCLISTSLFLNAFDGIFPYSQDALTSTTNGKLVNVRGGALVAPAI